MKIMNIPITQSREWHKLQQDLKEESFLEEGNNYHYLAIKKSTPVGNYLYLPYGPIVGDKQGIKPSYNSLIKLAKRTNSLFIRIEPQSLDYINDLPIKPIKSTDLNPKETWVLDLKGTEEDLKNKLPSRLLRYYRNAEKNGITVTKSRNADDIKYLIELQNALAKEKGINTFSEEYLKTEAKQDFATIYRAKYQNPDTNREEVVAAGLVFDDKTTRYNLQGAQNDTGRKLHATGILTIQLILDAKEKGLKIFDFWGIAPDNAPKDHPWKGFTAFKKTFAGYERQYAGTYDIVINKPKYYLYNVLRKINRLLRRG